MESQEDETKKEYTLIFSCHSRAGGNPSTLYSESPISTSSRLRWARQLGDDTKEPHSFCNSGSLIISLVGLVLIGLIYILTF